MDEPYAAALSTTEELAAQMGVDRATIIRFCRLLGYSGFVELRDAIRSEMPRFLTATEKLRAQLSSKQTTSTSVEGVFAQDIRNIEAARTLTNSEAFETAARVIATSDRTVVIAAGMSSPVGWTLAHLLRVVGRSVHFSEAEVTTAAELSRIDSQTSVVAVGFWRYVLSTVRLFSFAGQRTQRTIAITDSQISPLARVGASALLVPTDAAELSHSLVAPISVVNVLLSRVVALDPQHAYSSLSALDDIYMSAEVSRD